jgi:hypothetical protein
VARTIDPTLLEGIGRGRIEAAAGCGKTEAIVRLTAELRGQRTLILTHTLAGVAALRRRLNAANVPSSRYKLSSIDAWCVRRVGEFPLRAGPLPDASNAALFYLEVRAACIHLLEGHSIDAALRATYGRVFVDEYQDCGQDQHAIVCNLADLLPTFVFGDPLQAVFNFPRAPVISWEQAVAPAFPLVESLDHPWRWVRVGADNLGQWLVRARAQLQDGTGIDLQNLPDGCEWRQLTGNVAQDTQMVRNATSYWRRNEGSVLIMASPTEPHRHSDLARSGEGMQVVESLDLRTVFQGVARLEQAAEGQRLRPLLELAHSVMTGISVDSLLRRCVSLRGGRARTPATPDEAAALAFEAEPSWNQAGVALRGWSAQVGRRIFRREVLRMLLECLSMTTFGRHPTLVDALSAARERRRHQGRSTTTRAVGSTLLLKGLEADYAVLMDLDRLSAAHVYVALTRGTRGMLVLSRERWLGRTQRSARALGGG